MASVLNPAEVGLGRIHAQKHGSQTIGDYAPRGRLLDQITWDENTQIYVNLLLDLLIGDFSEAIYIKDRSGCFVFANQTIAEYHGFSCATDLVGKTDYDIHPRQRADEYFAREQEVMRTGVGIVEHCERNGAMWYSSTKIPIRDRNGQGDVIGLIGVGRDVTAQKETEALLIEQSRVIEMIALNAPIEVILERLIGLAEQRLPALTVTISVGALLPRIGRDPGAGSPVTATTVVASPPGFHGEEPGDYGRLEVGSGVRAEWAAPILSDARDLLGTVLFASDEARRPTALEIETVAFTIRIAGIAIERHDTLNRIRQLAFNDPLTGLFNRSSFGEKLPEAVASARSGSARLQIAVIDLDDFKLVNDTLGHGTGDAVLKVLSKRILAHAAPGDTVFRIGGDEFVVVQAGSRPKSEATASLKQIWSALAEPVDIGPHALRVTASIGVAAFPKDGDTAETLLKNADVALRRAKDLGRDRIQLYKAEIGRAAEERLTLNRDLHRALERQELAIEYQPQVDIKTGRIFGVEALLRWKHPTIGSVSPAKFIPLAEETGEIVSIGHWVLKQACMQCKAWQDQRLRPIKVSVNVSPRQFLERNWVASVLKALKQAGLDGRFLEIEITESCLVVDVENAIRSMKTLRAHGITIAIDDFGTGYSNLGALKRFPVSRLKIDRSFVSDMLSEESDRAIASAFISLGQKLGMRVIAEGVETREQLDFLRINNCDEIQGYLISRPVSAIGSMLQRVEPKKRPGARSQARVRDPGLPAPA